MKREWYAIFIIWLGLPLCIGIFVASGIFGVLRSDHTLSTHNTRDAKRRPERIVSLAPNLTEVLFGLGLDDRIVAVSNDSDYPPAAADKQKIGTFWQPNTEAIIAAKPDLIVTLTTEQQKSVAESLERMGYNVLASKIEKLDDLFVAIERIGAATGYNQQANELISNIRTRLDSLRSRFGSQDKVKVLWVVQAEPLRIVGRKTFINEMIELAGGENCIGPTLSRYPQIGTEEILTSDAEVIIQSAMGQDNIDGQQQAAEVFWKKWANLPAVKSNRIHVIEADTVLRLGPRLPEGVELIARYLHGNTPTQGHDTPNKPG
jgi:iron complex transport system substrate-binding protein